MRRNGNDMDELPIRVQKLITEFLPRGETIARPLVIQLMRCAYETGRNDGLKHCLTIMDKLCERQDAAA